MIKSYIRLRVELVPCEEDFTDMMAAYLADAGFESFEPDATGVTAYIQTSDYDSDTTEKAIEDCPVPAKKFYSAEIMECQDWNAEWEKNYFNPIVIADKCVVHASFHKDIPFAEYDIVIDPRMAFGTGHHATTSMMMRHILNTDMSGKIVIDMGAGTGILSILAKMKGATKVYGIEIDPDACANAVDNARLNNVDVTFLTGNASKLTELPQADYLFANINRNIILADLREYTNAVKPGGSLHFSGFYHSDMPLIEGAAKSENLVLESTLTEEGEWTSAVFRKQ